jgi:hypothetical protein
MDSGQMPKRKNKPFPSPKRKPRISYLVRNQLALFDHSQKDGNYHNKPIMGQKRFSTIFNELFQDRIFKPHGRSVFSPNYIPTTLFHREDVMRHLVNIFRSIITKSIKKLY